MPDLRDWHGQTPRLRHSHVVVASEHILGFITHDETVTVAVCAPNRQRLVVSDCADCSFIDVHRAVLGHHRVLTAMVVLWSMC